MKVIVPQGQSTLRHLVFNKEVGRSIRKPCKMRMLFRMCHLTESYSFSV